MCRVSDVAVFLAFCNRFLSDDYLSGRQAFDMQQIDTGGRRAKRLTGGCLDGRGYAAPHDVEQADVATFCALDDDVTPLCEEGYFGDREGVYAYERIVYLEGYSFGILDITKLLLNDNTNILYP